MNVNLNLPPEVQRLLPYIAVAVLAVVGLLLVVRGVGPSEETATSPPPIERPAQKSPDRRSGGERDGGTAERAPAKRSRAAYVNCVQQAADTAALEKCQSLLPR
jgi:hypothetical protein